jgi:hypothetical protein
MKPGDLLQIRDILFAQIEPLQGEVTHCLNGLKIAEGTQAGNLY